MSNDYPSESKNKNFLSRGQDDLVRSKYIHRDNLPRLDDSRDPGVLRLLGLVVVIIIATGVLFFPLLIPYETGGINSQLREQVPLAPKGFAAVSDVYDLQPELSLAASEGPWILTVKLSDTTSDNRNLNLYSYQSNNWVRIGPASLTEDGEFVETKIRQIPENVTVLRRTLVKRSLNLIVDNNQMPDSELLQDTSIVAFNEASIVEGDDNNLAIQLNPNSTISAIDQDFSTSAYIGITASIDISGEFRSLLSDEDLVAQHIDQISALTEKIGADGVYLSYLHIDEDNEVQFTDFVKKLSENLAKNNRGLVVGVPLPTTADTGAYNWMELMESTDSLWIQVPQDPAIFYEQLESLLEAQQAKGIDLQSISLIIDRASYHKQQAEIERIDRYQALSLATTLKVNVGELVVLGNPVNISALNIDPEAGASGLRWDKTAQALAFSFIERRGPQTVWIENQYSLAYKLDFTRRFDIGGISINDAVENVAHPDISDLITNFLQNRSIPLKLPYGPYLEPCWLVPQGSIGEITSICWSAGDPTPRSVSWFPPAQYGLYEIDLVVSDGEIFVSKKFGVKVVDELPDLSVFKIWL